MQQNIDALSRENLLAALLVILVLLWAGGMLMDFIIKIRTLRKPQEKEANALTEHRAECERRFRNDHDRLNKLETRVENVEEGQRVLCKGVYEILGHLLHNGNKDAMETASKDIFDYLNR